MNEMFSLGWKRGFVNEGLSDLTGFSHFLFTYRFGSREVSNLREVAIALAFGKIHPSKKGDLWIGGLS